MKRVLIMVSVLSLSGLFSFGDSTKEYKASEVYDQAKRHLIDNSDKIADDIMQIIAALDKEHYWQELDETNVNKKRIKNTIISQAAANSYAKQGILRMDTCTYSGVTLITSGKYKGWYNAGFIKCTGTKLMNVRSVWFSYNPEIAYNNNNGALTFEIEIEGEIITIYYAANPSPMVSCNNFVCLARAFPE